MARGRSAKSSEDMLVKSAEFVGWALGGLEREIAQTRERLAALNAHAVKLRARIGKGDAACRRRPADAAAKASRKQRRRADVGRGPRADLERDEEALGRAQETPVRAAPAVTPLTAPARVPRGVARSNARCAATTSSTAMPSDLKTVI